MIFRCCLSFSGLSIAFNSIQKKVLASDNREKFSNRKEFPHPKPERERGTSTLIKRQYVNIFIS